MNSSKKIELYHGAGIGLLTGLAIELQKLSKDMDEFQHHFCDLFTADSPIALENGQLLDEMSQRAAALSFALGELSIRPETPAKEIIDKIPLSRLAQRLAGESDCLACDEDGEVEMF